MAEYLLRNTLNPGKVVKCTITFRQLTPKGEEGEPIWLVEINTAESHKDGGDIPPVYIHYTSLDNLDEEIKKATEEIAKQIDWLPMDTDGRGPFVSYSSPTEGDTSVSIYSNVVIDIKDIIPSAGIDSSSIEVTVNGTDVTSEIELTGDPYEYRVIWKPFKRVLDTY